MAFHTTLPIYKAAYTLFDLITDLANALRDRGHSIKSDLKKTYRTKASRA